jgi:L-lactate dehydrogenase
MEDLKKIHDGVWQAAYEIIEKKRATYYGIGLALNRIVKAILNDENAILTVSAYLDDGKYGQSDIYIGVPAIINRTGIKELLELSLNKEDQAKLDKSCRVLKEIIQNDLKDII